MNTMDTTVDIGDDYEASDPNRPCAAVFSDPSGATRAYIFESLTEASTYIERCRASMAELAVEVDGWNDEPLEVRVVPIYGLPGAWLQGSQTASSA